VDLIQLHSTGRQLTLPSNATTSCHCPSYLRQELLAYPTWL
jgi:hypothetical protein